MIEKMICKVFFKIFTLKIFNLVNLMKLLCIIKIILLCWLCIMKITLFHSLCIIKDILLESCNVFSYYKSMADIR